MSESCNQPNQIPVTPACEVTSMQQMPFYDDSINFRNDNGCPTIKVPVVLTERSIQVVLETDISLVQLQRK